jgi:hypothetical protein
MRASWRLGSVGDSQPPRLAKHFGNSTVLAGVIATSLVGMALLGQIHAGSPFVFGVALPMMLVGAGIGASLARLTISGVAGVAHEDAGSASGLVGVAHQLGGALGLAVLVVVFASANVPADAAATVELAHRIGTTISGAAVTVVLVLSLCLSLAVPWLLKLVPKDLSLE